MKPWKLCLPLLALTLTLCACTAAQPQTSSPPPSVGPAQGENPSPAAGWDSLAWDEHMALDYAQSFCVDYAQEGWKRIIIDGITYLVVPEGSAAPEGTPEEVVVLQQPIQNIYLQATAAIDCFRKLDVLDAISLSGTQESGWYIPEMKQAMAEGKIVYAGKYSAPDYELIQSKNCGMALTSTMIYHNPEVKEQLERMGVPVLVERSSYESHPLGRMEWVKLYGALFNREEEAKAYFDAQLKKLEPVLEQESTGKTVAFFSVTSNGSVTVRKSGDYIAKAIELAGGSYVPEGLAENENALSTLNIQMETFYQEARDADVLIYNSTIEADLDTIDQLVAKSAPLADFKAVQSGSVWCTGKSMFQESQAVGGIIMDIHTVLAEKDPADGELTYLHRLR